MTYSGTMMSDIMQTVDSVLRRETCQASDCYEQAVISDAKTSLAYCRPHFSGLCEMEIPTGHCLSVVCGREASVGSLDFERDLCRKCWEKYCG